MRTHFGRRFRALLGITLLCKLVLPGDSIGAAGGQRTEPSISIQRTAVRSSNLASVGYAAEVRVLEVEFRSGTIYRYFGVAASTHEEFLRAESKGRYFARKIRGKYQFKRLEPPMK